MEDVENGLTARFRALLHGLWEELRSLDERIEGLNQEIEVIAETHPDAKRLRQLRGVGPPIATALVARFGNGSYYGRGRQAAASIGLTPRCHGTGGKNRLMSMTKQGDRHLRAILIQGGRAVVTQARRREDRLSVSITELDHGGAGEQDRAGGLGDAHRRHRFFAPLLGRNIRQRMTGLGHILPFPVD